MGENDGFKWVILMNQIYKYIIELVALGLIASHINGIESPLSEKVIFNVDAPPSFD